MPWSDIDKPAVSEDELKKQEKRHREGQIALAKNYHRTFTDEIGAKVLADLTNKFIMNNDMNLDAKNAEFEAGYRYGEASIVKYIIHMLQVAEKH